MTIHINEREFINYRPILGFKPNISWLTRQTSAESVEQFKLSELIDANSILASDLLMAIQEATGAVEVLIANIETCLRSNPGGPVTFDDYLLAKENGPYDTVAAFKAYHNNSVNGAVQAEVYFALLDVQDNLVFFNNHVRDTFFDGDMSSIDRLTKEENINLGARMVSAIKEPSKVDKLSLAIEAKLKSLTKEAIENVQDFISKTAELTTRTLANEFGKHIEDSVQKLATAPPRAISAMKIMTELKLANLAKSTSGIQTRLGVIDNKNLHQNQLAKVKKLKQLRLEDTRDILPWLRDLAAEDDSDIYDPFISCFTESMVDIDYALDNAILDVSKVNQLDKLNRDDLLNNLEQKKAIRQIYRLLVDIEKHFDRDDDPVRQTKRLVENLDLNKPGNVCSL